MKFLHGFVNLCLIFGLLGLPGANPSQAANPASPAAYPPITILPDQMVMTGDVSTRANTQGKCTASWFSDMPEGAILLGVKPTSCLPTDWGGGSAVATLLLPDYYSPTVYVMKISWPDTAGKGLHSPDPNKTAAITFDGKPLWDMRTTRQGTFNDYYALDHQPAYITLVVSQSNTHTLTFSVPPATAWDIGQISLTAYPMPANVQGIGFSPYRDCQDPNDPATGAPTLQQLQDDLSRLSHSANAIRTYSSAGVGGQIPQLANAIGLPVYAGAWLDYDPNTVYSGQDDAEVNGIINVARTSTLAGVIVGNEYYLRHRSQAALDYLGKTIDTVKNAIPAGIPVTTAEDYGLMFDWPASGALEPAINPGYRPILDRLDMVMVHIYPFWHSMSIDGAAAYTVAVYKAIQALLLREYPGKNMRLIIGETGWPSSGGTLGRAVPSMQNQRQYMLEFLILAQKEGVDFLYFDAYDELWKIAEAGHVGQAWGYSYTDRTAKRDFYGVLLPVETLLSIKPNLTLPLSIYIPAVIKGSASAPLTVSSFTVYDEWPASAGTFVPSGYTGDISSVSVYECDRSQPHSGQMSIRATFTPGGSLGWGGVTWQYPKNNWGNLKGGLDLSWANKLTFWARGEKGGEKIRFFVGGVGIPQDAYPDSIQPAVSTGFIQLDQTWRQYTLDLRGKDLKQVVGGFGWATDQCASPNGATFYLDDIQFAADPNLPPPPSRGSIVPVYTDAAAQGNHFTPSGWMGDASVPGRVTFSECWSVQPHSGQTSIRVAYPQPYVGWAGLYWVDPSGNWGDRPGGIDLTGAKRLTFWARSETPNAVIQILIGGVGYPDGTGCQNPTGAFADSVCPKIQAQVSLNTQWTKYTIDLSLYPRDMSRVVGGFGWVATSAVVFYLDDIQYEFQ